MPRTISSIQPVNWDIKQMSRASDERVVNTLFFRDDFEGTTPAAIGVTATTAEVTHNTGTQGTVTPFEGNKMVKVNDADATTQTVYYKFGKLADGKVALDVRWWKNSDTAAFEIIVQHYDKTTVETYKVKFLESGMKWQYWTSAGAYADITTAAGASAAGLEDIADSTWNYARLVIDLANLTYARLVTNGLNIDLSAIGAQTAADAATEGNTTITFGATTGAANKDAYYDDFRVYTNVQGE